MHINIQVWPRLAALVTLASLSVAAGCQDFMRKDERRDLTVLLVEYKGPEAAATAEKLVGELSRQGLKDAFVVEGAGAASVCVGHFGSWKDADADAMLKRVRQIRDVQGQYPFAGVMLTPVPEAMPANPWPLEKAKGYYTLTVASWEAPGRQAAAQAFARELRDRGFEAYVYHGPRMSTVTVGAYGSDIFDRPGEVGVPGGTPKIVNSRLLDLMNTKFPYMRLEGEVTPPEAHIRSYLSSIPGRDSPVVSPLPLVRAYYRVTLALIDTKTGLAEVRSEASGVAQSKDEILMVVAALVRQVSGVVPAGRRARVGLVGVTAANADAARDGADTAARDACVTVFTRAVTKFEFVGPKATAQLLDASGLNPAAVLRDPRTVRGFRAMDYVVTGSVEAFPVEGAKPVAAPPVPAPRSAAPRR